MGRRRRNPKALKLIRQSAGYFSAIMHLAHGNPRGQHGGVFITDDGRVISTADIPDPVSKEKKQALLRAKLYEEDFHTQVSECAYIVVKGQHYVYGLKRFFSGSRIFFQEETFDFIRRSIVYSSKDIAMLAFNTGRITWIEQVPRHVSPVPPVRSD